MPKKGDHRTAPCKKCRRDTTWRYVNWVYVYWIVKSSWMCVTCQAREAALRDWSA
jgi:hypothetical protein